MKPGHLLRLAVLLTFSGAAPLFTLSAGAQRAQSSAEAVVVGAQGAIELSTDGGTRWVRVQAGQSLRAGDRLRTGANSRLTLRLSDNSVTEFNENTEIAVSPPQAPGGLRLFQGMLSFFHRGKPGYIRVVTRGAAAGVRGTEFVMQVELINGVERTTLSLIDGVVRFENPQDFLELTNMQQAVAIEGQPPVLTAGFVINNVLQWAFYYPAVLNLDELPLARDEEQALARSIADYRAGELLAALGNYPADRQPASGAERLYYAALLLSVGQSAKAGPILEPFLLAVDVSPQAQRLTRLATALRQLIAGVKGDFTFSRSHALTLSSEFLSASYYEQSLGRGNESLLKALELARAAVDVAPHFAFAWARVAELEFSFGRTRPALDALDRSLELAPRNPQALALKGFLFAAQNKTRDALKFFDQAIAIDADLGNAWLGRGLVRIRRGDLAAGREDLLIAAAAEPQRSVLRSYLGKAYAESDALSFLSLGTRADPRLAENEFDLAKRLDPADPTAWLYSALLKEKQNRINEAIEDLERSKELNDNRLLYRSRLLLDQDQAVRSANLARIYADAGMFDVSVREAARAVNADYANYSGHLFLAESYNLLRDPQLINLRYETAVEAEYLIANLLAPPGAGTLSRSISQQEYGGLFARNRAGVVSSTEYLSRGAWFQSGSWYGTFGDFGFNLDALYISDNGQRRNNDRELRNLHVQFRQSFTPEDSVFVSVSHLDAESGDLFPDYDPDMAWPDYRVEEKQEPILLAGYHRAWNPQSHTLLLFSRLDDTFSLRNPAQPSLLVFRPLGPLVSVQGLTLNEELRTETEIYGTEIQHLLEHNDHFTTLGIRGQSGEFQTRNFQNNPSTLAAIFPDPPAPAALQHVDSDFWRGSAYLYHSWNILNSFLLIGGVSYDVVSFPQNHRNAPVSSDEDTIDQLSPKAGLIWTPASNSAVRFAFTRSLAGASLEQSYQIEPPQVAGFIQTFRSAIPESVAGANPGAPVESFGLAFEHKLPTGTYLGVSGEILNSDITRQVGAFALDLAASSDAVPSSLREHLNYTERALTLSVNQLLGRHWSLGSHYRVSDVELETDFVDVPDGLLFVDFQPRQSLDGILHHWSSLLVLNHASGFFARLQADWYFQDTSGYEPGRPDEDFWHFHAFAGYRFARRRAQLTVGILNIGDQDYRLDPLTIHNELPRSRTLAMRLLLNF